VLFFWFGFSIHTFFSYLQGRGMAARSMSSSSRRLGAGLVMVMVVLMLALVQLHSVAGAEAAAAAGKTYTVAWNYPFQQNFYTHWNQGTSYVVGDRLSKSVVLLLLPSSSSSLLVIPPAEFTMQSARAFFTQCKQAELLSSHICICICIVGRKQLCSSHYVAERVVV